MVLLDYIIVYSLGMLITYMRYFVHKALLSLSFVHQE